MNVKNLTIEELMLSAVSAYGTVNAKKVGKGNMCVLELINRVKTFEDSLKGIEKELRLTEKELEKKKKDLATLEAKVKAESLKRKIKDYFSEGEARSLIKRLKKMSKSDKKIAMFLAEQVFGKARGNIGIDGGEDGKPIMTMAAVLDGLESSGPIRMEPLPGILLDERC